MLEPLVIRFKQMVPIGSESFRGISTVLEGHQMLDPTTSARLNEAAVFSGEPAIRVVHASLISQHAVASGERAYLALGLVPVQLIPELHVNSAIPNSQEIEALISLLQGVEDLF